MKFMTRLILLAVSVLSLQACVTGPRVPHSGAELTTITLPGGRIETFDRYGNTVHMYKPAPSPRKK